MSVEERLKSVEARIAEAASHSGRPPNAVRLVGVSKGMAPALIVQAVAAGLQEVGENRVQEAGVKIPVVASELSTPPVWHLVGHLQSNKARPALELFDTIQSVDSVRIAQVLSRLAQQPVPVFLEVQFARAPDRFGFEPDALLDPVDEIARLPNMSIVGLMTVAPLGLSEEETRRVFRTLRLRRDELLERRPRLGNLELSMGMTDDFAIAIEEGATVVRIGRAIFAEQG